MKEVLYKQMHFIAFATMGGRSKCDLNTDKFTFSKANYVWMNAFSAEGARQQMLS